MQGIYWLSSHHSLATQLNSCIVKLSKLTKVTKVYRGMAGGVLPKEFWTPNKVNVRGGVEVRLHPPNTHARTAHTGFS